MTTTTAFEEIERPVMRMGGRPSVVNDPTWLAVLATARTGKAIRIALNGDFEAVRQRWYQRANRAGIKLHIQRESVKALSIWVRP